eukprot:UC4_evm1s1037
MIFAYLLHFSSSPLNTQKGPQAKLRSAKSFSKEEQTKGFVGSFVDLFSVAHDDVDGTGIGEDKERLETLAAYLQSGEEAMRKGTLEHGYSYYISIAGSLEANGDLTSASFIFEKALQVSQLIGDPEKIATAHARCGVCLERLEFHTRAAQHYEEMHALTKHGNWEEDISHSSACYHLIRAYTMIANDLEESHEWEKAIEYHMRCLARANEGQHPELVAEANYRLGSAYETFLEPQTALKHLEIYINECENVQDEKGLGRGHEAMGRCFVQLGEFGEATYHYDKLWTIAGKMNQFEIKVNAGTRLGDIFNDMKRYEESVNWYGKAYDVCRAHLNDAKKTNLIRIKYGIARANFMQEGYSGCLAQSDPSSLGRLLAWKSLRVETFSTRNVEEVRRSYSVDGDEQIFDGEGTEKDVFEGQQSRDARESIVEEEEPPENE